MSDSGYRELFSGRLIGLLQWSAFDSLWRRLADDPDGWYVRDFNAAQLPAEPMPAQAFRTFLTEAEAFLRRRHREDYCGFLYVDDPDSPTFIKVFDPKKMGSACGCGGEVLPRWTISRMPPELLEKRLDEGGSRHRESGRSFLRRLFG